MCLCIGRLGLCSWIGDVPGIRASDKTRNSEVIRWQVVVIAGSPFIVIGIYGECKGLYLIIIIIFYFLNIIIRYLIFRAIMILHWMSRNIVILVIPLLN